MPPKKIYFEFMLPISLPNVREMLSSVEFICVTEWFFTDWLKPLCAVILSMDLTV